MSCHIALSPASKIFRINASFWKKGARSTLRVGDPEGLIEVDVEHGESQYAKPGTLKREAKTFDHLMTHRYSNP